MVTELRTKISPTAGPLSSGPDFPEPDRAGEVFLKAGRTPASALRFTGDGSEELERHLTFTCARVLAGIQEIIPPLKLEALLLGGGYGRGEGGVLRTELGDQPYNDLEFYVFVQGHPWVNERRFGRALNQLAHNLTRVAGIEIEFKIISSAKLRRQPVSMFYYDLVMGHRRFWGDEKTLAGCNHHRDARNLPLSEATRLMMNRCTGLLLAHEKLECEPLTAEDADFIGRNLAKAQLAFGDVVLTAFGEYHWSCRERHDRLLRLRTGEYLPWLPEVRQHHATGVEFKLHPRRTSETPTTLHTRSDEITTLALKIWLWLESRRLHRCFTSARDYVFYPENKYPGTNPWRNRLVNAKMFGPAAFFQRRSHRHPREKVLNTLVMLLWEPSALNSDQARRLQYALPLSANSMSKPVEAYKDFWRRLS